MPVPPRPRRSTPLRALGALLVVATCARTPAARTEDRAMVSGHVYVDSLGVGVVTPMVSASKDIGEAVTLNARVLVDGVSAASWRLDGVSSASPEGAFGEWRRAGTIGATWVSRPDQVDALVDYSAEDDYTSVTLAGGWQREMAQRCTTLQLYGIYSHDTVDPVKVGLESGDFPATKDTGAGRVSLTQLLSRTSLVQGTYEFIRAVGYQSNPYLSEIAAYDQGTAVTVQDDLPDTRSRHALALRFAQYLPWRAAIQPKLRLYADDWGVRSVTAQVDYNQHVGDALAVGLRYRAYVQGGSPYYRDGWTLDDTATRGPSTLDVKYDDLAAHMGGVQLRWDLEPLLRRAGADRPERLVIVGAYDAYVQHHDAWSFVAHTGRVGVEAAFGGRR